jgi:hypothetical protein
MTQMKMPSLATAIVVAAVLAAATASAGRAAASCSPGVHPFGGTTARTFCGPAKATMVVGGKTIRFSGGTCERGAAYVAVNIGTVVLGTTTKQKPDYFGLVVGKAPMIGGTPAKTDGTYKPQVLTANHAGKGYAILHSTLQLQGNRTRGTFSGTPYGSTSEVTGTFSC